MTDRVIGQTYELRCAGCRNRFLWTAPETWWTAIPQFCKPLCRKKQNRRRARTEKVFTCPTPFKKLYTQQGDATAEAIRQARGQNKLYQAYRCRCGGLHVGHREAKLVSCQST